MDMTAKERLDQHDKQIRAIRELVHEGMRLVIQTRRDFRELYAMQKETAAAQKKTETALRELIQSLKGGGNGHRKKKLDM
jgi:hypothetical protein